MVLISGGRICDISDNAKDNNYHQQQVRFSIFPIFSVFELIFVILKNVFYFLRS